MTDIEFFEKEIIKCEKNLRGAMKHPNTPQRDFENICKRRAHYEAALMALKMVGGSGCQK